MHRITNDHRFWTRHRRGVILGGYLLILLTGTHWPSELRGLQTDHLDKVVHFAAFVVLGWLAAWVAECWGTRSRLEKFATVLFAIALFAAVDEVTQPYVGRKCDPLDWLADLAGATAGLAVYLLTARRSKAA